MLEQKPSWYVGTLTLTGAFIGALVGMLVGEIPLCTAVGVAIGAWWDARLYNGGQQDEQEDRPQ